MMEPNDPWQSLREAASALFGVDLDDPRLEQMRQLYARVMAANQTMNLTRITALEDFWRLHLLDSLSVAPQLCPLPAGFRLLDLGSGAGFPALPLAIVFPHADIVAVESVQKKARFIAETAEALGLSNVSVQAERSELLARQPQLRERFEVVTARAVAALNILIELGLPFLKPGGTMLAMKSASALPEEIPKAKRALSELGGVLVETLTLETDLLPNHAIAVIRKAKPTSGKYPRSPGTPAKTPL